MDDQIHDAVSQMRQFQDLNDTLAQTLQQKGFAHEAEVLKSIVQGKTAINIAETPWQGRDKFSAHHAATVQDAD